MAQMWISADQIRLSLDRLKSVHPYFGMTFLAFKERQLPVGRQEKLNFSSLMRDFLDRYYRPGEDYSGYYSPFLTSNPSNRWLTKKYPSGALQRITVDTYGKAIIHEKNQPLWGWRDDYVDVLAGFQATGASSLIPVFHLAVWLFRGQPVRDGRRLDGLIDRFERVFNILAEERRLFDFAFGDFEIAERPVGKDRISEGSLFQIIGWPPGEIAKSAVDLSFIEFVHVGPTKRLRYEPSSRVNIITGDNSLGKTFLLESVWWAITGRWIESANVPRRDAARAAPRIFFCLNTIQRQRDFEVRYDWHRHAWSTVPEVERSGGIAIYARYDGSCVVWDTMSENDDGESHGHQVVLGRRELWHGKRGDGVHGYEISICNGLLLDWVAWQTKRTRYSEVFEAFVRCLEILSPPEGQAFEPDEPIWMPGDEREIPALRMDYGIIPVLHASAGVKRIIGLAYVIIWAWFRHKRNADLARRDPHDRMVLIVDEVEAHLHPKWQRSIVPAILDAMDVVSDNLRVQAHFATHSPLVLASAEPVLRNGEDSLHHLSLKEGSVVLEALNFWKQGSVDAWLMSDVFGLKHARSMPAEALIERAKMAQVSDEPDAAEVAEIDRALAGHLRDDDEFWPRWRYFADSVCRRRN